MKPLPALRRLLLVAGALSVSSTIPAWSAEANPSPPAITLTLTNANGRIRADFPYPAAEKYTVLGTHDVTVPMTTNFAASGILVGPTFTVTNGASFGVFRVGVQPMSSNDLLSATVLNRLTYGPTPDDIDHIKAIGPQEYINEQMAPESRIPETLDTDPPIANPTMPLTNWIRVSASGLTSGTRTNILLYLNGPGKVYVDDIRVVLGTSADTGSNLLSDGDFELGTFSPTWNAMAPFTASVITNSPTPGGHAASGTNCLLLSGTAAASSLSDSFWAPFATNAPANQQYTLSFSYLPVQNNAASVLTVRLAGSQTTRTVALPPGPPDAPPAISAVYAKLTNTVASLDDFRAWHVFRAIHSQRQLHEVLAQFFQNHFTTQYQKTKDWFDNNYSNAITNGTVRQYLAVELHWREHRKFRDLLLDPNCTFQDLLKVSIESPAMVIYLDTVLSSKNAPNQNYAREILELHTMGADNGYIQQDIVDLAKVWTGWRVAKKAPADSGNPFALAVTDPTNAVGNFVLHYAPGSHDTNSVKRLFTNSVVEARFGPSLRGGQPYSLILPNGPPAQGSNGFGEGYRVTEHLANLPFTMEFVSVKLCRTFVHENFDFGTYDYTAPHLAPEAQLVKDCMTAWNTPVADRKGNIRSVLNVIFNSALFRGHAASQQKVKTPLEFAVSAVRALRTTSTDANGNFTATADCDGYGITGKGNNTNSMTRMGGMGLFDKPEPDGWSEFGRIWLNTANLCERMRFAQQLLMPSSSPLKTADYLNPGLANVSDPVKLLQLKLPAASWNDPGTVADFFLGLLYPGEGKANLELDRQAAIDFLNSNDAGVPGTSLFGSLSGNPAAHDSRVRGMVGLLMSLPRFQEQ